MKIRRATRETYNRKNHREKKKRDAGRSLQECERKEDCCSIIKKYSRHFVLRANEHARSFIVRSERCARERLFRTWSLIIVSFPHRQKCQTKIALNPTTGNYHTFATHFEILFGRIHPVKT